MQSAKLHSAPPLTDHSESPEDLRWWYPKLTPVCCGLSSTQGHEELYMFMTYRTFLGTCPHTSACFLTQPSSADSSAELALLTYPAGSSGLVSEEL